MQNKCISIQKAIEIAFAIHRHNLIFAAPIETGFKLQIILIFYGNNI